MSPRLTFLALALKAFKAIKDVSLQKPEELEPGHFVEFNLTTKKIKKVKFYKPKNNIIKSETEILNIGQSLHNLLDESAKNRTMADVPICSMLSG